MKRLPVKAHTLSKKIRLGNPWGHGKELADLIDCHWDSLKGEWPKENHTWIIDFAKRHGLSSGFVFKHGIYSYL